MQKIFVVVLALCAVHDAVAWPMQSGDSLTNTIMGAKQAIQTINFGYSMTMRQIGNQIALAKAQLVPPMRLLQQQVDLTGGPCAVGVQVILAQNWVLVNQLDGQCRYQSQNNAAKNNAIISIKQQIGLAEQSRNSCRIQADYLACTAEAATTIEANVAGILAANEATLQGMAAQAEQCVAEGSTNIQAGLDGALSAWEGCKI